MRAHLQAHGLEEAAADARMLLLAACAIEPLALLRDPDVILGATEAARLDDFARRRAAREPASRIVGQRPFWTLDLAVRPGVLDPRADTEALVRLVLRTAVRPPARILDLGCGSGAILCALLSEWPRASGVGVDLSMDACAATQANLQSCGLASRAQVLRGSWFEPLDGKFDLIVSNPPYIPTQDISALDLEVRNHDPHLALDGGADGLTAYRAIFSGAAGHLARDGIVAVEIGFGQGPDVVAAAGRNGLRPLGSEDDLAGRRRALAFGRSEAQA